MLGARGPLCTCRDASKIWASLIHSFEELHIAYCGKEGKHMAAAVGWPFFRAVPFPLFASYPYGCASLLLISEDKFLLHLLPEW